MLTSKNDYSDYKPNACLRDNNNDVIIRAPYAWREKLIDIGCKWDNRVAKWKLPKSILAIKQLQHLNIGLSDEILHLLDRHETATHKKIESANRVLKFITDPYRHQIELVELSLDIKKALFLCDVGTGKTKAAIDSVSNSGASKTLVVAPACTLLNFQSEVKKHAPQLDSLVLTGPLQKRREMLKKHGDSFQIYIINYEMLSKLKNELILANFDMVIFDEIHYLKNYKSIRSRAAYKIVQNIPLRLGLTGTLIANTIQDAFGPYKVIDDTIFGEVFSLFKNRYLLFGGYDAGWGPTQLVGYKNIVEFKELIAKNSLKYEIDDVKDLPEVIEVEKIFDLSPTTRTIYRDMKMGYHETIDVNCSLTQILNLQKICSGFLENESISNEKIIALLDLLEEIGDKKVVIWCRFRHSIDKISEVLQKNVKKHLIYDGRTSKKDIYKQFNDSGDINIMISQLQMGIGWECPAAKYAIFYELDCSLNHLTQAKGRIRRLFGSEKGSCVYLYLLARNSIEEVIYGVLKEKDFTAQDALEYVKGGRDKKDEL